MTDPDVVIRPETVADYPAIADIHLRAFGEGYAEGLIVSLHRQRTAFEPRLSLVAELRGEVVGHILYSPRVFRLLDADELGVNLSPLGVHPVWQGQGIGGALIEAGNAEARRLGYAFCTVLGHKEYYPRFGYLPNAYGTARLTIPAKSLPPAGMMPLESRKVAASDASALRQLWEVEEARVDLAIVPDNSAAAWFSPDPRVACTVYLSGDRIVGYCRAYAHEPNNVRTFLAADQTSALLIAAQLARSGDVALPLHPNSGSMPAFARSGQPEGGPNPYSMAKSLVPGRFDEYYDRVRRGDRPAGRTIWPAEFDV